MTVNAFLVSAGIAFIAWSIDMISQTATNEARHVIGSVVHSRYNYILCR